MRLVKVFLNTRGFGLVADEDIPSITKLGEYLIKDIQPEGDVVEVWDGWVETPLLGRYLNHSQDPNTFSILKGKYVYIYTKRTIRANEEITVNYLEVAELINLPTDKCEEFGIKNFEYIHEIS
jgi:hypothetical protein